MFARMSLAFLSVFCVVNWCFADDGPATGVPGLAELSHYVGDWDTRITSPNSGFTTGSVSTKWILGGRFVEQNGKVSNADGTNAIEFRTIITYNVETARYQSWTYLSTGSTMSRSGTWDAAAQTFKYTGSHSGMTIVSQADFSVEDTETWKISVISDLGTEEVVISGVNTRRE
jgi:hypothetical protein